MTFTDLFPYVWRIFAVVTGQFLHILDFVTNVFESCWWRSKVIQRSPRCPWSILARMQKLCPALLVFFLRTSLMISRPSCIIATAVTGTWRIRKKYGNANAYLVSYAASAVFGCCSYAASEAPSSVAKIVAKFSFCYRCNSFPSNFITMSHVSNTCMNDTDALHCTFVQPQVRYVPRLYTSIWHSIWFVSSKRKDGSARIATLNPA